MVSNKKNARSATPQRVNSTPTKQVVLLEEDEEDIGLSKGIIRSEVNFLTLPFFSLSRPDAQRRMKSEYHAIEKRGDKKLEVYWKVAAHQDYGYPGVFDRKVHKAMNQSQN